MARWGSTEQEAATSERVWKAVAFPFKAVGVIILVLVGLFGAYVDFVIMADVLGWGLTVFLNFAGLLPLFLIGTPVYVGLTAGNWAPLILIWGGSIVGLALYSLGARIARDEA